MGLPLMSRCSCVAEVSDESVPEDVLDDVLANIALWEIRQADLYWMMYGYDLDGGLNAMVVSALRAGTGKTTSLPLLRCCSRIEDASTGFL
jgi:hypothetical protein